MRTFLKLSNIKYKKKVINLKKKKKKEIPTNKNNENSQKS